MLSIPFSNYIRASFTIITAPESELSWSVCATDGIFLVSSFSLLRFTYGTWTARVWGGFTFRAPTDAQIVQVAIFMYFRSWFCMIMSIWRVHLRRGLIVSVYLNRWNCTCRQPFEQYQISSFMNCTSLLSSFTLPPNCYYLRCYCSWHFLAFSARI